MGQVSKELTVALVVNKLNTVFPSINPCRNNQEKPNVIFNALYTQTTSGIISCGIWHWEFVQQISYFAIPTLLS